MDETPSQIVPYHKGDDDKIDDISSSYDYARPKGDKVHHRGDEDRLEDISESVDYARAFKEKVNHLGNKNRIDISES